MKKFLIVGLGNPGAEYENTRHNIGFLILDAFAKASNVVFEPERYAMTAEARIKGRIFRLIKPTTFMNLSGNAVRYWMQEEKIPIENVLVVVDDLAIPFGSLRMKGKGSDAGHNGLKDIQAKLGRSDYPRLKFGIGDDFPKARQVDYVLGEWNKDEALDLPALIEHAVKMCQSFGLAGINTTMNQLNKK
ncbi:MAG: aminoacyl-tRNA hydrolase [Schleiferiaceae bacterium]